jgi:hypothetical protein
MNTVFRMRQPRNWWNTVALCAVAASAFLMIWLTACSSTSSTTNMRKPDTSRNAEAAATPGSPSGVKAHGESTPTSLANAGEYGENVYDYAKANDWKNAGVKIAALRDAVKNVRADITDKGAVINQLDEKVATLDRAVTARDKQSAMREANQVTLDVANMTAAYKLSVPVEVTRLDFYGRELEVWAQARDANKLQATASEMRREWSALRPSVEAQSAIETKKFDALVAKVDSAKTPADYAHASTPVLDEVDNLEKLLH